MKTINIPQVLIVPLKPALITGVTQKLPVLIRVQAPDTLDVTNNSKRERRPYSLSLVIDRSGSMSGEPLHEAVRCARHIVDRLAPSDVASVVVFDDHVKTIVHAHSVGDRKVLHAALTRIHSGGSTNLHGGWFVGMNEILDGASQSAVARVILLSDGNANVGDTTDTHEIAALCADAAIKGVTTSTYGLGRNFNEELMVEMGRLGGGNHYYGDTAADLFEPFDEEFDFISNLYARHVRVTLVAPEGGEIKLLNDYPVERQSGNLVVQLPDIPLGAEAWMLAELKIPAELAIGSGSRVLNVFTTATDTDGQAIAMTDVSLSLHAVSAQAWDAILPEPLVATRLAELEASRFLDRARRDAERGDWEAIKQMIIEAQTRFAEFPWVMEVLSGMAEIAHDRDGARFLKEAMYSKHKMSSRVSAKEEVFFCMSDEAAAPSYLRRKKLQGKAQFTKGAAPNPNQNSNPKT